MTAFFLTLFLLLGFRPENETSIPHPKPSGGEPHSAVSELLAEGAFLIPMPHIKDITGKAFGRLTAVSFSRLIKHQAVWNCQCSCGNQKEIRARCLGVTTFSCGCQKIENVSAASYRHGLSRSREYYVWLAIKQRCLNPRYPRYADYGGRGIKLCKRWHNFVNFLADMGARPRKGLSVERRDNNLGYFKSNCSWETQKVQCNNTRRNRLFTLDGETLNATQWAERYSITGKLILNRIDYLGWDVRKAITESCRRQCRNHNAK